MISSIINLLMIKRISFFLLKYIQSESYREDIRKSNIKEKISSIKEGLV